MTVPTGLDRRVYTLPGWHGSGPDHWQTQWEGVLGATRVEQDDWVWPRRGDWMARLDEVLQSDAALSTRPALLVAHSLGCHLVAAWAAHSRYTALVHAALLVAPPDLERPELPPQLAGWRPVVRRRLPFRAIVVASSDDGYAGLEPTASWASELGAGLVVAGPLGHLNAESGLGDWPAGQVLLGELHAAAQA